MILIFDAHHLVHRMYHSVRLTTTGGVPSGIFYGMFRTVNKLCNLFHPDKMFMCFDGPNYREYKRQAVPDIAYKAQRIDDKPDTFWEQVEDIKQALKYAGVPVIDMKNVESDDAVALLAKAYEKIGEKVVIVSSDKDLWTLISKRVRIMDDIKNHIHTKEQHPFPEKYLDMKVLAGDPSDNIPGVKGVGPKTAEKIISLMQDGATYADCKGRSVLEDMFYESLKKRKLQSHNVKDFQSLMINIGLEKYKDQSKVIYDGLRLIKLPSKLCPVSSKEMFSKAEKMWEEGRKNHNFKKFKALCLKYQAMTFFSTRSLDAIFQHSFGGENEAVHKVRKKKKTRPIS